MEEAAPMLLAAPPLARRETDSVPPPMTVAPEKSFVVRTVSVPVLVLVRPVGPVILPAPVSV